MSTILETLDATFSERQTTIAKDLKLNLRRLIDDSSLSKEESALLTIALARAVHSKVFLEGARTAAKELGLSAEKILEAEESAAIMGMLNIYYRYRHFIEHSDATAKEAYGAAKLRMTSLANPLLGKQMFELLALAVSAVNGCEMCVSSHEKALMQLGVEREKLHNVARLAAVMKGLKELQDLA